MRRTSLAFALWAAAVLVGPGCGGRAPDAGGSGDGGGADAGPDGGGAADAGPDAGGATCGDIVTFETGLVPTSEIHVAVGGNDLSGDGSAAAPYGTVDRAVMDATPGAAVVVHAGTYPGGAYVQGLAGTAGAPIWIGGAAGEAAPVFDGFSEGLQLSSIRYVVVHDLEVANATANGINCDDTGDTANPEATRYVVFRNLAIHDIGMDGNEDCLKLSGVNDYWVLDSTIARCGGAASGSGVDHVGCHRGLLARNTFTEMSANAVQSKGGSDDIELRWNLVVDGGERAFNMGGSTGTAFFRPPLDPAGTSFEARNIRAIANVIVGGTTPIAFVGCVDCLAAHNTIVDPQTWLLRILQETVSGGGFTFAPASGGRFADNLVYFDRSMLSAEDVNVGADTDPASFVFQNNLWFAHDAPAASAPLTLPVAETGAVVGMDPGLTDPASGDYTIGAASPAAGAGISVPEETGDFTAACWATPPAIGAYEVP